MRELVYKSKISGDKLYRVTEGNQISFEVKNNLGQDVGEYDRVLDIIQESGVLRRRRIKK